MPVVIFLDLALNSNPATTQLSLTLHQSPLRISLFINLLVMCPAPSQLGGDLNSRCLPFSPSHRTKVDHSIECQAGNGLYLAA